MISQPSRVSNKFLTFTSLQRVHNLHKSPMSSQSSQVSNEFSIFTSPQWFINVSLISSRRDLNLHKSPSQVFDLHWPPTSSRPPCVSYDTPFVPHLSLHKSTSQKYWFSEIHNFQVYQISWFGSLSNSLRLLQPPHRLKSVTKASLSFVVKNNFLKASASILWLLEISRVTMVENSSEDYV